MAFNGAEPVRAATIEKFTQRFARYGFDARALMPVYGLAESAVGLTFPPLGRGPLIERIDRQALAREGRAQPVKGEVPAMSVVSCGRPLRGHEVRVLDAGGGEAPERIEGRIEFRGPSATSGYFNNAKTTAKLMRDGWLDTGDVGYIAGGELFITSRVKDLIIRGGHNIHPYDLEEAVGALPGIRKGCVAVFGATDRATGTERIVVVAETREKDLSVHESLKKRINELAIAHLGGPADHIVLAGVRVVLKTSSGKIRRAAMRELYERGMLGAAQRPVTLQLARLALEATRGTLRGFARRLAGWLYAAYAWCVFALLSVLGAAVLFVLPRAAGPRWARAVARALIALSGISAARRRAGTLRRRAAGGGGGQPFELRRRHRSHCSAAGRCAIRGETRARGLSRRAVPQAHRRALRGALRHAAGHRGRPQPRLRGARRRIAHAVSRGQVLARPRPAPVPYGRLRGGGAKRAPGAARGTARHALGAARRLVAAAPPSRRGVHRRAALAAGRGLGGGAAAS